MSLKNRELVCAECATGTYFVSARKLGKPYKRTYKGLFTRERQAPMPTRTPNHSNTMLCHITLLDKIMKYYSRSPKVGNLTASILKSNVYGIPALIVLIPVSNFLGFTVCGVVQVHIYTGSSLVGFLHHQHPVSVSSQWSQEA